MLQAGPRTAPGPCSPPRNFGMRVSERRQILLAVPKRARAISTTAQAAAKQSFGSFKDLLRSSDAVLVGFYAQWCGPCQIMSKVMEEVSLDMKHSVRFAKVDTERYPAIASQYQVSALPTLVLFKNGQPVRRFEGALGSADLRRWLQESLGTGAGAAAGR